MRISAMMIGSIARPTTTGSITIFETMTDFSHTNLSCQPGNLPGCVISPYVVDQLERYFLFLNCEITKYTYD